MKKMNKKGFTLAELLIVIAIIAVLIAIAIPTFSGALENARRQTDHANIRAAYSVMQVAKMSGGIPLDNGAVDPVGSTGTTTWIMEKDGSFTKTTATNPYKTKAAGDASCADCAGCPGASSHASDKQIKIVYTAPVTGATPSAASWEIVIE